MYEIAAKWMPDFTDRRLLISDHSLPGGRK